MVIDSFGRMFFPVFDIDTMDLEQHVGPSVWRENDASIREHLHYLTKDCPITIPRETDGPLQPGDRNVIITTRRLNNSNAAISVLTELFSHLKNKDQQSYQHKDPIPPCRVPEPIAVWSEVAFIDAVAGDQCFDRIVERITKQIQVVQKDIQTSLLEQGLHVSKFLIGTDHLIEMYLRSVSLPYTEVRATVHADVRRKIFIVPEVFNPDFPERKGRLGRFLVGERSFQTIPVRREGYTATEYIQSFHSKFVISSPVIGCIDVKNLKELY